MTHVDHLLKLIAEGEALRDQMRREMEVMAEIIQRQNATAKSQGAMLVKAEGVAAAYKTRMASRDKNNQRLKRDLNTANQRLASDKAFKTKVKQYILDQNGGVWPAELREPKQHKEA